MKNMATSANAIYKMCMVETRTLATNSCLMVFFSLEEVAPVTLFFPRKDNVIVAKFCKFVFI